VWPTALPDPNWCHALRRSLRRFAVLEALRRGGEGARRSLAALQKLVKPEAQPAVKHFTCL
jgi:hypothetical protein